MPASHMGRNIPQNLPSGQTRQWQAGELPGAVFELIEHDGDQEEFDCYDSPARV